MRHKSALQLNSENKKQESKFAKFRKASLYCLVSIISCIIIAYLLKYFFLSFITVLSYSDFFKLKNIVINCEDKKIKDEVLLLTGLDSDQSVLKQNLKNLRTKILMHPSVVDAKLKIKLPDTLMINLKTRTPVAISSLDKLYFVDEQGHAYKRVSVLDTYDYPVITGVLGNDMEETEKRLKNATEILKKLREVAPELLSWGVSELHYVDERFVYLYLKEIRAGVRIHTPEIQEEMGKLTKAIVYLREIGLLNKVTQIIPYHTGGVAVALKEKL